MPGLALRETVDQRVLIPALVTARANRVHESACFRDGKGLVAELMRVAGDVELCGATGEHRGTRWAVCRVID